MSQTKQLKVAMAGILLAVGIVPVVIYQLSLGLVPAVTASEAIQLLDRTGSDVLLLDVRDAQSYRLEHIDGAALFPWAELQQIQTSKDLPAGWQEKSIVVICSAGITSAKAVQHLRTLGLSNIYNVRGGMQEWAKAAVENPDSGYSAFVAQNQASRQLGRTMSLTEQSLQLLTGFIIKPAHMILSVILIWILRNNISQDIALVKWALVALLVGESFCALNFLLFNEDSLLAEHIHNTGMIVAFTLIGWAAIEGLETRVLRLGAKQKPCALVALCGRCDKLVGNSCKARQLYKASLMAGILVAFIPLTIEPAAGYVSGWIFGTPYFYSELYIFQLFEARFLPVVSILFLASAWATVRGHSLEPIPALSRLFTAAGIGSLGFALFRLGLHIFYEEQTLWFSFWEEATELLFVALVAVVLWVFSQRLLGDSGSLRRQLHFRE